MTPNTPRSWTFLTSHARVLMCIAQDSDVRLREIGAAAGITERAAQRVVADLVDAGYVTRERTGRRNHYAIHHHLPLPDTVARGKRVSDLLTVLTQGD